MIAVSIFLFSCKKDFLDAKPTSGLIVPSSISDFQAILDNPNTFNLNQTILGEASTDDYFIPNANYQSVAVIEQGIYTYAQNLVGYDNISDWDGQYRAILLSNLSLEGIDKITPNASNAVAWGNVKGTALFKRSFAFFNLAQEFAKGYNASTASTDLGIILKLNSDVNEHLGRSTIGQTYNQIIGDLRSASNYLQPLPLGNNFYRPSLPAVYGLLARVYLSMGDYNSAYLYADSCLQLKNDLDDFNTVNPNSYPTIKAPDKEVIYDADMGRFTDNGFGKNSPVDTNLFASYAANDLRAIVYFKPYQGYQISTAPYTGGSVKQMGLVTDEIYLIHAESNARLGRITAAMNDLNTLLSTRWRTGTYINYTASSASDALNKILIERRKELVFRGTRWTDLRRLNLDPNYATTLSRTVNGTVYTLPPNDPRYVFPIPSYETLYNSNVQQNIR
jgi:hypothetical protein